MRKTRAQSKSESARKTPASGRAGLGFDSHPALTECSDDEAMEGLVDQAKLIMEVFPGLSALDAALLVASQRIENWQLSNQGLAEIQAVTLREDEGLDGLSDSFWKPAEVEQRIAELANRRVVRAAERN